MPALDIGENVELLVVETEVVSLDFPSVGPQGAQGIRGDGGYWEYTAPVGFTVGGGRVLSLDNTGNLIYADNTINTTAETLIGISVNSAIPGDIVRIVYNGEADDSGWTWLPGKQLYVGINGVITQTPPTSGYVMPIGIARSPTKIVVQIRTPIITV